MIDGVGVSAQGKDWHGSKECKVGAILRQKGEEIKEIATFCTWQRINGFRNMLEWVLIGIYSIVFPVVMISDGAKWIRNLRKKIPCLKNATWILDWFHLKDNFLSLTRALEIDYQDKFAQNIITLLWLGRVDIVIYEIKQFDVSEDEEKKERQETAIQKFLTYLHNQREGIINYQAYQMKGYFVGSGFVEKRNDTLIKNRMVRQKRMRWGKIGGEAIMQLLTAQANDRLYELFA
jgi:hypothetical protein